MKKRSGAFIALLFLGILALGIILVQVPSNRSPEGSSSPGQGTRNLAFSQPASILDADLAPQSSDSMREPPEPLILDGNFQVIAQGAGVSAYSNPLRVVVIDDEQNRQRDIPLELVYLDAARGNSLTVVSKSTSAGDGIATFDDRQLQAVDGAWSRIAEGGGTSKVLGVRLAGMQEPGDGEHGVQWIQTKPIAGKPFPFVASGLGWIDLNFNAASPASGLCELPTHVGWKRYINDRPGRFRGSIVLDGNHDRIRIGPFGLGWDLELNWGGASRAGPYGGYRGPGPTKGALAMQLVAEYECSRMLVGTALLPSGEPMPDTQLMACVDSPSMDEKAYATILTDADACWTLRVLASVDSLELSLFDRSKQPWPNGSIAVNSLLGGPDQVDVGSVIIAIDGPPERVIAAGRVLDALGNPISMADVFVYQCDEAGGASDLIARGVTDVAGEFEIVKAGDLGSDRIIVSVRQPKYMGAAGKQGTVGERRFDFDLREGGVIACEVLCDRNVPQEELVIRFQGDSMRRIFSIVEFGAYHKNAFRGLPAASYKVKIDIRSSSWTLFEATVEVNQGQLHDLGLIDLRGKLQNLNLQLTDSTGRPLADDLQFSLLDHDGKPRVSLQTRNGGRLSCIVPADSGMLILKNPKYASVTLDPNQLPQKFCLVQ